CCGGWAGQPGDRQRGRRRGNVPRTAGHCPVRPGRSAVAEGRRATCALECNRTRYCVPGKDVRMLHHLSLGVRDLDIAGRFYDAALAALGYRRVFEDETAIGYGVVDDEDALCLKL